MIVFIMLLLCTMILPSEETILLPPREATLQTTCQIRGTDLLPTDGKMLDRTSLDVRPIFRVLGRKESLPLRKFRSSGTKMLG